MDNCLNDFIQTMKIRFLNFVLIQIIIENLKQSKMLDPYDRAWQKDRAFLLPRHLAMKLKTNFVFCGPLL